jgi:hypothetical protein
MADLWWNSDMIRQRIKSFHVGIMLTTLYVLSLESYRNHCVEAIK